MFPFTAFFLAFATSVLAAVVILATGRLHGRLSHDHAAGVQKLHHTPVPRIGGLAVLAGLMLGGLALPPAAREILWLVSLAGIPAFGSGLIEDLTKNVGVRIRLLATIAAGIAFALLGGWRIDHVDLPGIDLILGLWLPSLLFTGFAIGGIANAMNIIDGVNGLASGSAIIMFIGAAIIAGMVDDHAVQGLCLIMVAAIGGFFVLNFPGGRIFLGDAGAYGIGFVLACVTVMLPARNPQLSPIIGLLLLSYPVIETMVSIRRRIARTRPGSGVGNPDRLHLHSLVWRDLARRHARSLGAPDLRNPLAAVLVWPLPLLATALAIVLGHSSLLVWLGIATVLAAYLIFYRRVALMRRPPGVAAAP